MNLLWLILIIPVSLIFLLLVLPVYLYAYYDGEFRISARIFGVKFNIPLTGGKKRGKPKKKKGKKPRRVTTDGKSFLSQLERIKTIVTSVRAHLLKAFRIKRLKSEITVATGDPCDTALLYGAVNAAVFTIVSAADGLITVDKRDINITADYSAEKTSVYIDIVMRTFLYKLLIGLILVLNDGTIKINSEKS